MNYDEYRALNSSGQVKLGVNNSVALGLVEHLPGRYRAAHNFWSWTWMLSIPGFIAVAIFVKWWIGLGLLFFVTPAIAKSVKKSAAEFVLEHAEANEDFFNTLAEQELLLFQLNN